MRVIASRLSTYLRRSSPVNLQCRKFSSQFDERALEEEAERKIGWLFKLLFAGTATYVAYQFMPYMGDNVLQQSVSLLTVKDPLFKRMGASRLARFAVDDERRMRIVELGGAKELLNMLKTAKDDPTRIEALRALEAISRSESAVEALKQSGANSIFSSLVDASEDDEIKKYKVNLLNRVQDSASASSEVQEPEPNLIS